MHEAILLATVTVAAIIDLRCRRIPNWLTASAAVLGLALALREHALATAGAGLALGLVPGYLLWRASGPRRLFGAGDAKLLGAVGLLGGAGFAVRTWFLCGVISLVVAIAVAARRRVLGPTLAALAWAALPGGWRRAQLPPQIDGSAPFAVWVAIAAMVQLAGFRP